jgi:metal iron transporter
LLIPQLPLIAGCALSILDVMTIIFFYNPSSSMRGLRLFELFVCLLVLGAVICFCIQLSLITGTSVGEVFKGYCLQGLLLNSKGRAVGFQPLREEANGCL